MYFVYFLKSKVRLNYIYTGYTNNISRRLAEHNAEDSQLSTKPYRPLEIASYIAVATESRARDLEQYFKTGSGKAFLKKHLL